MVFSSITFVFYFLPIFLIGYYLVPAKYNLKNVWILLFSLIFYAWGETTYVLILFVSILMNYVVGYSLGLGPSKFKLAIGIVLNIGLLFFYKYCSFFIANLLGMQLVSEEGLDSLGLGSLQHIHLPLGISFFTFQGVSYLIDVYRGHTSYERNVLNLGMYIAMFPQLIAGPIVRYKTIYTQIRERIAAPDKIAHGVLLFIIGLAYKVLLANNLAIPADEIFAMNIEELGVFSSWTAILAYTFQIYFDFCGYSTMAVGLGLMLGFKLPVNFKYPYLSASITEFWRRWHITLSQWFRDYLYIPLGGNRRGYFRTYLNLWIVFLLCGIWHGAAWTFLYWGIFHGTFLVIERLGWKRILDSMPRMVSVGITFLVVILGWVLFRSESQEQALSMYRHIFTLETSMTDKIVFSKLVNTKLILIFGMSIILSTPLVRWIFHTRSDMEVFTELTSLPAFKLKYIWWAVIFLVFVITISAMATQTYNPFIYYRF